MKCQIPLCKYGILCLAVAFLSGQPKLSIDFGLGFYEPTMAGFDDNEDVNFPTKFKFFTQTLLWNVGTYYEFFSNARVGYNSFSSFAFGQLKDSFPTSAPVFYRTIKYRMFPLETFFRLKPNIELNFTLTPIWGRGKITLETKPASGSGGWTITDDWNVLFNSFDDDDPLEQVASDNNMKSDWIGYSGMIGIRYYFRPWMGLDFKAGFLNNGYNKEKWRFQGKRVMGPDLTIDDLPIFSLKLVYALR